MCKNYIYNLENFTVPLSYVLKLHLRPLTDYNETVPALGHSIIILPKGVIVLEWSDAEESEAKFLTQPSAILHLWWKYTFFCLADMCEPRCQRRSRLSAHSTWDAKRMKKNASQCRAPENRLPTQELLQVVCVGAYSGTRYNL